MAGDRLYARVASSTPVLTYPNLEVYRPDGSRLCTALGTYVAAANCLLDSDGTHTMLIMGRTGSNAGPFGLYLQRVSNPMNVGAVEYGGEVTVSLAAGQVEGFTFTGQTGDATNITLSLGAFLSPRLELYRPDGTLLCSGWGTLTATLACSLDLTGVYTLLVMTNNGSTAGDFLLKL